MPADVRRLADGVLTPKLGGAHDLVYFETDLVPRADQLVDRATAGDFTRGVVDGGHGGYFAQPRELGRLGGGTVYTNVVAMTRDGSGILAPAPIGALLDLEIARLTVAVAQVEGLLADRRKEAEESLSPARVAARRAAREQAWQRETRDPAALAQRLEAAHRTDLTAAERQLKETTIPAQPTPQHPYWGPTLALDSARTLAATLTAEGRAQPACGTLDRSASGSYGVRFVVAGSVPGCVPMMQVRTDLLDPTRPSDEVQLLTVLFCGDTCGEVFSGARAMPNGGRCHYAVPLLREMDWALARAALGWPAETPGR